jgi:hypothetical protein
MRRPAGRGQFPATDIHSMKDTVAALLGEALPA